MKYKLSSKNEKSAGAQLSLPYWRRIHLLEILWAVAVLALTAWLIINEHR